MAFAETSVKVGFQTTGLCQNRFVEAVDQRGIPRVIDQPGFGYERDFDFRRASALVLSVDGGGEGGVRCSRKAVVLSCCKTVARERRIHLDVSYEERKDAENTGVLIRKKLSEIMDLQADIDALLREKHPTPFGSERWKNSRPETLQRLVALTAIQFLLLEPDDLVKGNDELKVAGEKLIGLVLDQLKMLGKGELKG
jgi:hypothetical protein